MHPENIATPEADPTLVRYQMNPVKPALWLRLLVGSPPFPVQFCAATCTPPAQISCQARHCLQHQPRILLQLRRLKNQTHRSDRHRVAYTAPSSAGRASERYGAERCHPTTTLCIYGPVAPAQRGA